MMHQEDPTIALAPSTTTHKLASLTTPPILRLPRELLNRCLELMLSKAYIRGFSPFGTRAIGYREAIQKRHLADPKDIKLQHAVHAAHASAMRLSLLTVCREFRTVGLEVHYAETVFTFKTDAQLQHFLTTTPPRQIARVQHIELEFRIVIRLRCPGQNERTFKLLRNRGVYNFSTLANFPKLKTAYLWIVTGCEWKIKPWWTEYARSVAAKKLPGVLAMQTWPESVPCPTYGLQHAGQVRGGFVKSQGLEFVDGRPREMEEA